MKTVYKNKGFTLLELMVALGIFIVVSIVAVSIFITSVQNQRRQFSVQNLQDNGRYILEAMAKEIRMGKGISNPPNSGSDTRIVFRNQDDQTVTYQFASNNITRQVAGSGSAQPMNSSQVRIEGMFYVINDISDPITVQSRISVRMRVYPVNATQPEIRIQNTIALRAY